MQGALVHYLLDTPKGVTLMPGKETEAQRGEAIGRAGVRTREV